MPHVMIAYDEDLDKIGSTVEVSAEEASALVFSGRGRLVGAPLPEPDDTAQSRPLPPPSTDLDINGDEPVEHDGD